MPPPLKTLRLLWTFYTRNFIILSILVNAACMWTFHRYGYSLYSTALIWLKAFTLVLAAMFVNIYRKQEYHYYHSHGLSKTFLMVAIFVFDLVLYLFLIDITNNFR